MKTSWAFYYHILKLCIPVFCFQTQDSTLAEWMEDGMKIATPVMTYVYQEDEGVDEMTVLAAWENAKQQEKRSKQVEKNNEKNTEVTPEKEENLENKVNIENNPWQKQTEVNRDKLLDFDYLMKNFYRVDRTTTISASEFNPQELLAKDLRVNMEQPGPVVLIYHTHSQEGFADSDGTDAMSVMGLGDRLASLLQNVYGIPVLHHIGKYDVDGRDYAYANAQPHIQQVLNENPTIQVVIDLHRDGVGDDVHLVTEVDGRPTAKVMFFNGLSRTTSTGPIDYLQNPNLNDNLATSLQMQIAAAELYPGFTRPVFLKGYRYNMHMCPKSMLIEVGAQTNTFGEAYNAMEPLANIISYVLLNKP